MEAVRLGFLVFLTALPILVRTACPFSSGFHQNSEQEYVKRSVRSVVKESSAECSNLKYRTYDGYCNNLLVTTRGMANTNYARLLPLYDPSKHALPPLKNISEKLYPDKPIEDPEHTLLSMQYGQFVAHDISSRVMPKDTSTYLPQAKTTVSSYLDLSIVYGNDAETAHTIRSLEGGMLKMDARNGEEWPMLIKNAKVEDNCSDMRQKDESCYVFGDTRSNQNPQLALIHVIFMREHNRLAAALAKVNPDWDDEKLYQEARKINIAQHQHIAYYHYLPMVLGKENCIKHGIIHETDGFVNDYNETVDATAFDEHGTAAFRYYHTMIAGHLRLMREGKPSNSSLRLSDWIGRPQVIEKQDFADSLAYGLAFQPSMGVDPYHTEEITKYMFKEGRKFGEDLKVIDMRRCREHGIGPYNNYRELCGLPKAKKFDDFKDTVPIEYVKSLSELYANPDDVELSVGGTLETHLPNTYAGPTNHCILLRQFQRTRIGDRFWFENSNDQGFTTDQLKEIRLSSISRILCDNASIRKVQRDAFKLADDKTNPIVDCDHLPTINVTLWKEHTKY